MDFVFVGERLAVDLLNTVVVEDGQVRDLLKSSQDVVAWARATRVVPHDLLPAGARRHEPAGLRSFREALRHGLAVWKAAGMPPPPLIALLNRHLARDPEVTELALQRGRVHVRGRSASRGEAGRVYAAVARSAAQLLAEGDPRRLRKCANPSCRLMFYDVSKAGRRRWCSMQTCGARAKASAFYRRRRRGITL